MALKPYRGFALQFDEKSCRRDNNVNNIAHGSVEGSCYLLYPIRIKQVFRQKLNAFTAVLFLFIGIKQDIIFFTCSNMHFLITNIQLAFFVKDEFLGPGRLKGSWFYHCGYQAVIKMNRTGFRTGTGFLDMNYTGVFQGICLVVFDTVGLHFKSTELRVLQQIYFGCKGTFKVASLVTHFITGNQHNIAPQVFSFLISNG